MPAGESITPWAHPMHRMIGKPSDSSKPQYKVCWMFFLHFYMHIITSCLLFVFQFLTRQFSIRREFCDIKIQRLICLVGKAMCLQLFNNGNHVVYTFGGMKNGDIIFFYIQHAHSVPKLVLIFCCYIPHCFTLFFGTFL